MSFNRVSIRKMSIFARLSVILALWLFMSAWKLSWPWAEESARTIKFRHSIHVQKEEMECTDCHEGAVEKEKAGMPAKKFCMDCHEEKMDMDDKEGCLFCHNVEISQLDSITELGRPKGSLGMVLGPKRLNKDVKFSHKHHAEKEVGCPKCHGDVGKDEGPLMPRDIYVPTQAQCRECHTQEQVSLECTVCHKTFNKDNPPEGHQGGWRTFHGMSATLNQVGQHGKDCLTCHVKNDCTACHTSEAPRDHTRFWRTQGHGLMAGWDRERCSNCHRQDFCVTCHSETAPRSHVSNWDANHCTNCHLESNSNAEGGGCRLCHRQPAHLDAIKWPPLK
ncbi:cytochrome c3 family protein [Deltaproteobacteria bacterium TL4]